jgi:hypothetical protein
LAPEAGRQWEIIAARFPDGSRSEYQEHQAQAMSRLLSLPVEHEIRSTLDTSNLNALEKQFLELAFGQNITKARGLSGPLFRQQMRNGNERLNDKLRTILPASMELKFVLDRMADDPLMFSVHLRDKQGSETLLHTRGSGLRKILTLLVGLMNLNLTVENVLIVSDEPEISLHADNQHLLRTFLEEL